MAFLALTVFGIIGYKLSICYTWSPFFLFSLAIVSLYPFLKALLGVHFPASVPLTATLCLRPDVVYREGDSIIYYLNQDTFERERRSY